MSTSTPVENTAESSKSTQKQPTERVPGTTTLPLARIKRVIKEDKDVSLINAEATFCIAYATELFMEYLVNEAFVKAKKDKRKTVYYKDLASTVKETDQLEFLEDVIPTTMTLKAAIEKRKETLNEDAPSTPSKKQKTNTTTTTTKSNTTDNEEEDEEEEEEEDEEAEAEPEAEAEAEVEAEEDDTVMDEPKQE